MAQENLSNFISQDGKDDLIWLEKTLVSLTDTMEYLALQAQDTFKNLGQSTALKQLIDNMNKATQVGEQMTDTVKKTAKGVKELNEEQLRANLTMKERNDLLKLQVQYELAPANSIAKMRAEIRLLTAEYNKLDLEKQKDLANNKRAELDQKNAVLKATVDQYTAQKINIGNYPDFIANLERTRRELDLLRQSGQETSSEFQVLSGWVDRADEAVKEYQSGLGPTQMNMNELTNTMTRMALAGQTDTKEFKDMGAQVRQMSIQITNAKQAVADATNTTDKFAAATNKGQQASFAMSQVIRELPSFAYSTSTGILAVSNNIPILADRISELKKQNVELIASGKEAVPVWETLGESLLSFNTLLTIGISVVTVFAARMGKSNEETKKAASALEEYNNQLEQFNKGHKALTSEIRAEATFETSKANSLLNILKDMTLADNVRFNAYKQLQTMAPGVFDNLNEEQFLTAENTKRINEQIAAMEKYIPLQVEINKKRTEQNTNLQLLGKNQDLITDQEKKIADIKAEIARKEALEEQRIRNASRSGKEVFYNEPISEKRALVDEEKKMIDLQKQRNQLLTSAIDANVKLQILEKDRAILQGGGKPQTAKDLKDNSIENEKALSAALFAQWEEQVKTRQKTLKEVMDDEDDSYEARKKAMIEFYQLEAQLNEGKLSNEYGDKLFEISHMKKDKNETDKSFAEKKKIANEELRVIELKYNNQVIEDKKEMNEALKKLDENEIELRLANVKQAATVMENNKATEFNNEKIRFERGLISQEQFNKNKQKIDEKYALATLLLQKELLEGFIAIEKAAGVDTKKLEEELQKIINKIKELPAPSKDNKSKNPLLALFGITDEQWGQAVKLANATIDLQREITKAIDQRYQREIDNLEHKKQMIGENYDAEINAIQGSFASEEKKSRQISVLKAQQAQQEKAINEEIVRQKRKMAQADKVASISEAIQKGAVAVVSALETQPVWLGIAMAALVGATVAVQVANAANTPLPQYATGTEDHPGGPAMVGELYKPEWIVAPGKAPQMVNKPTVMNLPAHTRVIPEEDLLSHSMEVGPDGVLRTVGAAQHSMEFIVRDEFNGLRGDIATLTDTVKNKKETHINISSTGFRKFVKANNNMVEYLDSNFN